MTSTMPALYIGHGAPPLLDDPVWGGELATWAKELPRPTAILIVSAHWEAAPLALSATAAGTPLVYDFGGFNPRYYRETYSTGVRSAASAARAEAGILDALKDVAHQLLQVGHVLWL